MAYWLVKSEPSVYSWEQFQKDGKTSWEGVRNYAARNHLKAMKKGDEVFYYHSNEGLEIVGIAQVAKEHYPDPTTDEPGWVVVNLVPVEKFPNTVTLAQIKKDELLKQMDLVRLSRLSVVPVKREEFDHIVALAHDKK